MNKRQIKKYKKKCLLKTYSKARLNTMVRFIKEYFNLDTTIHKYTIDLVFSKSNFKNLRKACYAVNDNDIELKEGGLILYCVFGDSYYKAAYLRAEDVEVS